MKIKIKKLQPKMGFMWFIRFMLPANTHGSKAGGMNHILFLCGSLCGSYETRGSLLRFRDSLIIEIYRRITWIKYLFHHGYPISPLAIT